ncbi:MAG: hypothetical protein ACLU9S_09705 [Oscillospiraceae bacterium]
MKTGTGAWWRTLLGRTVIVPEELDSAIAMARQYRPTSLRSSPLDGQVANPAAP